MKSWLSFKKKVVVESDLMVGIKNMGQAKAKILIRSLTIKLKKRGEEKMTQDKVT